MRDSTASVAFDPSLGASDQLQPITRDDTPAMLAGAADSGRLDPETVASLIVRAPHRRDAVLLFLQQTPRYGNTFVQQVLAAAGASNSRRPALSIERETPGSIVTNHTSAPTTSPSHKSPGMTGDRYLDDGAYNDRVAAGRLFGEAHSPKRGRVIDEVRHRIAHAGVQCGNAILSLRMDKLAEKSESDLPMLLTFLIGAASTFVGGQLANVAKLLFSSAGAEIETDLAAEAAATEVREALSKVTTARIAALTKGFSDLAKAAATGGAKAANASGPKEKQAHDVSWLDRLADQVADSFSAMRSEVLGMATDGDLLVLLDGFAAERHHQSAYKSEIAAKLERFETSGLNNTAEGWTDRDPATRKRTGLGRRAAWTHGHTFGDRSVIRVEYTSGKPGHFEFRLRTIDIGGASASGVVSEPDEHSYLDPHNYRLRGFVPPRPVDKYGWTLTNDGEVPREFENEAIALQIETWGRPPEVVMREDRQFAPHTAPTTSQVQPVQVPGALTLQPASSTSGDVP